MPSTAAVNARTDSGTAGALHGRLTELVALATTASSTAAASGARRECHAGDGWLYLHDPDMPELAHGWKLHVSTRPDLLPLLLEVVVPILLRRTCDAKFAADAAVLRELNAGVRGAAAVGKAVTVYPSAHEPAALGEELAEALAGWDGPRVVSDRRVRADAPVYYRYGPFRLSADDPELVMTGPAGERFTGLARDAYRQPPWAEDPFDTQTRRRRATTRVGDGRYRITAGITRSPNGHVYRAVELATGQEVVVKQARAFVAEDTTGVDARGRLRHERQVLTALAGLAGVPRLVDYFRHGEDEYLVSSACGPRDLRREVLGSGPYDTTADRRGARPAQERGWWTLARGLLRILDAVHARGVVVRDLKPANVVLDASGGCSLVDFGVSALDGARPDGATRGYGLPLATETEPADDYYALGTTLSYAATGLDPVVIDPDPATNRDRTLACLAAALARTGRPAAPVVTVVTGLLSLDPAERTAAAATLRRGEAPPATRAAYGPPTVTAGLLDEVVGHLLTRCVRTADELVAADRRGGEPRKLLSLYDGGAGLGLELLQHADRPDARAAVVALARWTADHPSMDRLGPGLYDGRAGVDLFLAHAADPLGTKPSAGPPAGGPGPGPGPGAGTWADAGADPLRTDQISGAAGVGTARLLLARRAAAAGRHGDARIHLAVASACAHRLTAGPADPGEAPNPGTAALAEGFAHGRAGLAHFLLALPGAYAEAAAAADRSGAEARAPRGPAAEAAQATRAAEAARAAQAEQAARSILDALAADVPRLVADAARPGATRRYGSWCRGLAGIGTTLVQAGRHYGEDGFTARAAEAATACRALAPRMGTVGQCCGLAGVGELLVDLAVATGDERHWRAAEEIAGLILTRGGGPPGRPLLPGADPAVESATWAVGTPGVLSFLRRLQRRGGPRPGMLFPS
ncbi:class IV lanthionine synthetase LanL [Streptomyces sp. BE20]|uniref:class IV lanthionine synthetase LanL n=1 Tax=Streptomyces sp. BE20 TaxID=3002525 RepID=UPI002E77B780|nr:class IV lanthionine synthetase LanL [Streptomyces sp. BE20]MEE1828557.1 class IV lanthionine synthetase LanL [Streptomyces sp. BE20]